MGTTIFSHLWIRRQSDPGEIQISRKEVPQKFGNTLLCKTSQMCAVYLSSCVFDSLWHVSILTLL